MVSAILSVSTPPIRASAACSPATTYGSDMLTLSVPAAATYRVWVRMMAPDTTNNTFDLEVDGGNCITVGGGSISANTWTWVDYQNGNTSSTIDLSLSSGAHNFNLIGIQPSVAIDRVVLTSDTSCVPTGTGDNCANPADTTPPTVSLTAPANNATVSGASVAINATASDNATVSKVEFYINGSLVATDFTSSYGITWDSTGVANGSYILTAKAYDSSNNATTSTAVNVTVNNVVPDTTKPTVNVTAPVNGSTVSGTVTFSATASDNVSVARVDFSVDGVVKNSDATSPYTTIIDTTTLTNAAHTFTATAYDGAGNSQATSVTVTVNNTVAPVSGDVNGDNHVTIQDLAVLIANYGKAGGATKSQGDVNGDGKVNVQDLAVLIAHYGQ